MSPNETPKVADPDCPGCRELRAMVLALEARIRDHDDIIKKLKGQDRPAGPHEPIPPPAAKQPTGKKPGGQTGHKGTARKWLAKERVTTTVTFVPETCECCDHALSHVAQPNDPEPTIYQTYELPPVLVNVTQYEGHARTCSKCQHVTHRAIPVEHTSKPMLGPSIAAMNLYLVGQLGVSKRDIQHLLEVVFQLPVSLGVIIKGEREATHVLAPMVEAIRKDVRAAPVIGFDETGWKVSGHKRWLWVAATLDSVLFQIHPRRNLNALQMLLGVTAINVIKAFFTTDRWKVYKQLLLAKRQLCWAHINRNWQKLAERVPKAAELHSRWQATAKRIFATWHDFKNKTISLATFRKRMKAHAKYSLLVIENGTEHEHAKVRGFCERLNKLACALFTFAKHPKSGLEPTNNHTERVQRRAVLWRRSSFGCTSETGCRFVEKVLTVVETLKRRGQSFLTKIATAINAYRSQPDITATG